MKRAQLWTSLLAAVCLGMASTASAVVIDFTGGTAYLPGGVTYTPTNTGGYAGNVLYYIEDGIRIDFIGGYGDIGNYYGTFAPNTDNNSVLHNHWTGGGATSIVFSKVGGGTFDLNYMDLTSNTVTGGGLSNGTELSYVTPSGGAPVLLPSSHWGIDHLSTGAPGDGIKRLWMDSSFDGITSFTVTSQNAYCFGLDNFYIDEPAPPGAPDSATTLGLLAGAGLLMRGLRRRFSA
ncbi:MAG: hypothetical protein HZC55_02325 [Verrucomicrobia bacterium]|nr:hypothetical protein [Verrucomicrobiota bacterium]